MNRTNFFESYIQPAINHPAAQITLSVVSETVKILAVKLFLELLAKRWLSDMSKLSQKQVYVLAVLSPLVEEVLFRGLIQKSIHLVQYLAGPAQLTEQQKKADEVFRVRISALIYASSNFINPHKTALSALVQFSWTFFGGIVSGYLSEKYRTLSAGILMHGVNNIIAMANIENPNISAIALLALVTNKLVAYGFAVTEIDEAIRAKARGIADLCWNLPGNFRTPSQAQ